MKISVKNKNGRGLPFLIFMVAAVLLVWIFGPWKKTDNGENLNDDLARIKESGTLHAVVDNNSTNYFIYRGRPMGFQYELLQNLCRKLEVKLDLKVSNNLHETFNGLKEGKFEIVAKNLTVTPQRKADFDFTVPLYKTRQVLVQRRKKAGKDTVYISGTAQLGGKVVYVQKNTSHSGRLHKISDEIGKKIIIVEDTIYGVEQLIARVARGEIDYTVCDENIAVLNQKYFPNLDVSLRLSFPQNIAWALRKGSPEWKATVNSWIQEFRDSREFAKLYHRYFESPRTVSRMESDLHSINGNISDYDDIIKKIASEYGWDWRLIASVIYHESRFNAEADSWVGAKGLMQLMPSTAEAFGIEDHTDPEQNIRAGVLFLNWLNDRFLESIPDSSERVKFVLAAYNIGLGHVYDAQRLAEKYGFNPKIWNGNTAQFLEKKSMESYYNDTVVHYGYCRGIEAVNFVGRVTENYRHYINLIPK